MCIQLPSRNTMVQTCKGVGQVLLLLCFHFYTSNISYVLQIHLCQFSYRKTNGHFSKWRLYLNGLIFYSRLNIHLSDTNKMPQNWVTNINRQLYKIMKRGANLLHLKVVTTLTLSTSSHLFSKYITSAILHYSLDQSFSTTGPRSSNGPWQQLYRAAWGLREPQYATRFH
jgi:hypothetical protein